MACVVLGRSFERVSLDQEVTETHVSWLGVQFSDDWNEESLGHYRAARLDVKDLLIAFAGGAAEAEWRGVPREAVEAAMTLDKENIGYAITTGLEGAGDDDANRTLLEGVWDAAWRRAVTFVKAERQAIGNVASALHATGSLTFNEVVRLRAEAAPT